MNVFEGPQHLRLGSQTHVRQAPTYSSDLSTCTSLIWLQQNIHPIMVSENIEIVSEKSLIVRESLPSWNTSPILNKQPAVPINNSIIIENIIFRLVLALIQI